MKTKITIILILSISLISCNENLRKIDFNSLPIEYMNSIDDISLVDLSYKPLPAKMIISSSTNKLNLSSDLLAWGDSMLIDLGKTAAGVSLTDDWTKLCNYTLGIITNEKRFKTIAIELGNPENDILTIEHIATEYVITDDEYIKQKSLYRYPSVMKYHFKMSINKDNDRCEGMKHLVFLDDYLIYSPMKLK